MKHTFWHNTGFCRFRKEQRRCLSRGNNFLQQLRRSGVSQVCGEKVAAARTEKLDTHTEDDYYTPARVMTTKVPSSRPCINLVRPNISTVQVIKKFLKKGGKGLIP